jgi:hypothetical protein
VQRANLSSWRLIRSNAPRNGPVQMAHENPRSPFVLLVRNPIAIDRKHPTPGPRATFATSAYRKNDSSTPKIIPSHKPSFK